MVDGHRSTVFFEAAFKWSTVVGLFDAAFFGVLLVGGSLAVLDSCIGSGIGSAKRSETFYCIVLALAWLSEAILHSAL